MINIEIAKIPVAIDNRFSHIEKISRDYLTASEPHFTVSTDDGDLAREAASLDGSFCDAVLESTAVFRKIAEKLPEHEAVVFHGAVIAYGGRAYAVTARSGVGKTTHMRLWLDEFSDKVHILNGDKPILRFIDGTLYACGTPWRGKEGYGTNEMLPLGGIALLRRDSENSARRISPTEGCGELMSRIYLPKDAGSARKTLAILSRIVASTPLFELFVNMNPDAARVALDAFLNK